MYYATGTAHAPLQAPADWIEKFRGRFAGGYDRMREEIVNMHELLRKAMSGGTEGIVRAALPAPASGANR